MSDNAYPQEHPRIVFDPDATDAAIIKWRKIVVMPKEHEDKI